MKIASLLPSATEIVCLLGLEDELVGITHECDYPEAARRKPVLTATAIDHRGSSSRDIDRHIKEQLHGGSSVYRLDRKMLEKLDPDLILTQELCEVCAVSYTEVQRAVRELFGERQASPEGPRRVISLEPSSLEDILETVLLVGRTTGREVQAVEAVAALRARVQAVAARTAGVSHRPRVYCMEWVDPPYAAGHWVPEMVELAGGVEGLGRPQQPSQTLDWEEIRAYQPEVVVLMPCGYNVEETLARVRETAFPAWWQELPAVRSGQVYAVNGSAYFARPGPRIVDGLEILAQLLHPELGIRDLSPEEARPLK